MAEYVCKVWSADRRAKKSFMTVASIQALIQEAANVGLKGSKLVLENDGTEICSDAVLEYYLRSNSILMLLEDEVYPERPITVESLTQDKISLMSPGEIASSSNEQYVLMTIPSDVDDSDATTLTMSSSALTSSSETTPQAKKLFENFQIPWNKVPSDILDMLRTKKKLGKKLNILANILVDEMRMFSFYIPMSIFRSVAQQAATKYPESFLEKDSEGNIISLTSSPLLTIMRNRNNFLNRSPNKKTSDITPNIPFKKRRQSNMLQTTCTNWQPSEIVPPNTIAVMNYKQKYLQNFSTINQTGMELIKSYMKDCFVLQRQYFNNMDPVPSINDIQSNWPWIFNQECLHQYFTQLLEIEANVFIENYKQYLQKCKTFLASLGKKAITDALNQSIHDEIGVVLGFLEYFGEKSDFIFMDFEFGTTIDEIILQLKTNAPIIVFVKCDIENEDRFLKYIFIEKIVAEVSVGGKDDFIDLLTLINFYFVFNIMYPKEISQTMEFLVRFCYKHYPKCTRGLKKNINNMQKVNNLIAKLTNF